MILLLVCLRFVNLTVDPPLYQVGHGQSQLTDPYHLTHAARNAALFDDWHPFDFHRWDVFKNSLVSGAVYLLFSVGGVSRLTANLAAVLLSTSGLLLFLLALWRRRERWEVVVAALIIFINNSLFFYGRMPYLENGLIFIAGLLFYLFIRFHDRLWGQLVVGLLIALAALAGKAFGLLLIVPVLLGLLYRYRAASLLPSLAVIGGAVVGGATYLLLFYGTDFSILTSYVGEQTTGIYGGPPGFTSIPNFFRTLVTYGGEAGLWRFSPFFMVLISLSIVVALLTLPWKDAPSDSHLPIIVALAWVGIGMAALSPFQYRPMRYALFLLPAAATVVAYAIRVCAERRVKLSLEPRWLIVAILFPVWYLIVQLRMQPAEIFTKFTTGAEFVYVALLFAVLITLMLFLWLLRERTVAGRRLLLWPLVLLLAALTVLQGSYLYRGLWQSGYQIEQYNRDLADIISPGAVVTGPYMPVMTINTDIQGVIYQFGLASKEDDLVPRFGITHVLAESDNWKIAMRDFPVFRSAVQVSNLMLRDQEIGLFRLADLLVPPSEYEQAQIDMVARRFDSALVHFQSFVRSHPKNLIAQTGLVRGLASAGQLGDAIVMAQSMGERHPDNYYVQSFCEGFFRRVYQAEGDRIALGLADKFAERALEINPHIQLWQR